MPPGCFPGEQKRDSPGSPGFFAPFREFTRPLFARYAPGLANYLINEPGIMVLSMLQIRAARLERLIRCCLAQSHTDYSGLNCGKTCRHRTAIKYDSSRPDKTSGRQEFRYRALLDFSILARQGRTMPGFGWPGCLPVIECGTGGLRPGFGSIPHGHGGSDQCFPNLECAADARG